MADFQSVVRRAGTIAAAALFCVALVGAASAEPVQVQFDCYPVIACRDVTPEGFSALRPGEKVIEARIRVSARIVEGAAEDLREMVFEIQSPGGRSRIDDFEPKTRMDSELVEPIQITKTDESRRSLGLGLGGSVAVPAPGLKADIQPTANISTSQREAVTSTVKKRPPKRAIVISGTTDQGQGVFFKLRPSSQTSLEGVHELKCRLRVPGDWRGDWLLLACRAEGRWTRYFVKSDGVCGESRYVLGLHAEGDAQAMQAAEMLARAQSLPREVEFSSDGAKPGFRGGRLRECSEALAEMSGSER